MEPYPQEKELKARLEALRAKLAAAFRPDTAAQGFGGSSPSAGQCAAAAIVIREIVGGDLVSALVEGVSHWFNRVKVEGQVLDIDLTGDQFGRPTVQIADASRLYPEETRVRGFNEVTRETLERARRLAERAGFDDQERTLAYLLREKTESTTFATSGQTLIKN